MSSLGRWTAGACACLAAARGVAQGFNVDFDIPGGSPEIGFGVPSPLFGAAANQPGVWNRVLGRQAPRLLTGLDGTLSAVTLELTGDVPASIGSAASGNAGDYGLLMNDVIQVADVVPGGYMQVDLRNLASASYEVYVYAVSPFPHYNPTPVRVFGAAPPNPQFVTGPLPLGTFDYLVTHSLHRVEVSSGGLTIRIDQPPGEGYVVNGFQVRVVPEPSSLAALAALLAALTARKKRTL